MPDPKLEAQFDELNNIYDELVARGLSCNQIIPEYSRMSWTELCLRAIEILANMGVEG